MALADALSRLRSPGYQYARLSSDTALEMHVGGHARLPDVTMTDRMTLNAYSLAKTLTATAVLLLAERGALELDAPLGRYLAIELPYEPSPTIRQTLAHSGGLPNPLPLSWVHRIEESDRFDRAGFLSRVLRDHPKLMFAPGQRTAYSNVGYLLLGEVVAYASGTTYEAFVEQEIVGHMPLPDGAVLGFSIPDLHQHADGHIPRFGLLNLLLGWFLDRSRFVGATHQGWVAIRPHYANGAAYGGLIANAAGLAAYLRALLGRGDLLSEDVRRLLIAPVVMGAGRAANRTLGWFTGRAHGHEFLHHAGGGAGYYCEARFYPYSGRASVLMLNRAGISDARVLDRLDAGWLGGGA